MPRGIFITYACAIVESFIHAGASNNVKVNVRLLRAEDAELTMLVVYGELFKQVF